MGAIFVSRIHGITSSGGLCKGEKMEICWFYFGFLLASPGARLVGEQRVDPTWIVFEYFQERSGGVCGYEGRRS